MKRSRSHRRHRNRSWSRRGYATFSLENDPAGGTSYLPLTDTIIAGPVGGYVVPAATHPQRLRR